MACDELVEIDKDCENNIGGATQLLMNDQDELLTVTKDEATGMITAATINSVFVPVYFKRNVSSYTEEAAIDLNEGSTLYKQTVTLALKRRDGAKSAAIKVMGQGQRFLALFMKDGNGLWWYFPETQLATDTGGSGVVKADGSKYDLTFTGEAPAKAYQVEESVITTLLTAP